MTVRTIAACEGLRGFAPALEVKGGEVLPDNTTGRRPETRPLSCRGTVPGLKSFMPAALGGGALLASRLGWASTEEVSDHPAFQ
jgi:hypothetical protein